MPKFSQELRAVTGGGSSELVFSASEDLSRWLDAEGPFWLKSETPNVHQNLRHFWDHQRNFFANAINDLVNYEEYAKHGDLKPVRRMNLVGRVLHPPMKKRCSASCDRRSGARCVLVRFCDVRRGPWRVQDPPYDAVGEFRRASWALPDLVLE